jgi:hypothetical protein
VAPVWTNEEIHTVVDESKLILAKSQFDLLRLGKHLFRSKGRSESNKFSVEFAMRLTRRCSVFCRGRSEELWWESYKKEHASFHSHVI